MANELAREKIRLAEKHLEKVLGAWDDPTDWYDLSLYGFYCLEAAVEAVARHLGMTVTKRHWDKVTIAERVHRKHGLPDVSDLLKSLNAARKAAAYGDVEPPELDAEDVASQIELFVEAVKQALAR